MILYWRVLEQNAKSTKTMKQGWEIKKIKDICDKASSNIAQNKITELNGDYPVYGASGFVQNVDFYHRDTDYIGVVKDGSGVGRINVYPAYSSLLGTLQYILPKEGYALNYVAYALKSLNLAEYASGAAIPHIYFKDYGEETIPVPPREEQERIVEELDCLSGIIEKKRQQLKELDALAQSIFYEMFGDPVTNEKGWEVVPLSSAVDEKCPISYGIVQPMDDIEDGVPIVRPVDLIETFVYNRGLKKTSKEISDSYKRTILRGDEILMCVRGTTGIVSLATEELSGCNTTRGIVPLFFTKMNRWFMFYLFKSDAMVNLIAENTYGIALKQINIKNLRQLPIVTPSLPLQQTFASKIEAIEKQKELIKQSLGEVETLFNARMQEYFG